MFKRMDSRGPDGRRDGRLEDGTPPTNVDLRDHAEMVLYMKMVICLDTLGYGVLGLQAQQGTTYAVW
jgi:hypothetical protein